jgi:hypothetical protein
MIHMRAPVLATFLVSTAFASDPAKVHTKIIDGKAISFWVENKYHAPITRFQVAATSSSGNLGCSITAEVKQPKDLRPRGTCSFGTKGRELMDTNWKARIVYVEFADGMRWAAN